MKGLVEMFGADKFQDFNSLPRPIEEQGGLI